MGLIWLDTVEESNTELENSWILEIIVAKGSLKLQSHRLKELYERKVILTGKYKSHTDVPWYPYGKQTTMRKS